MGGLYIWYSTPINRVGTLTSHNFIHLLKRQHNNESENLTNQQHETLKRYLAQSTQRGHMFSEAENFCRNLHFLLLTETDGNKQLNISMQQLATSYFLITLSG